MRSARRWIPWTLVAVLLVCGRGHSKPAVADEVRGGRAPQQGDFMAWVGQLADELDHLQEDLYFERSTDGALVEHVDRALEGAVHFQRAAQVTTDGDHLRRDFREVDRVVHELLDRAAAAQEPWLRRAISRIRYADQQIHYHLHQGVPEADVEADASVLARHAQLLRNEIRELDQVADNLRVRTRRDVNLKASIEAVGRDAEHFQNTVRQTADLAHLQRDFQQLDEHWNDTIREINRSPYGVYLRRHAQRVNRVHRQIQQLVAGNVPAPPERESPRVEFEIPGIGRFEIP